MRFITVAARVVVLSSGAQALSYSCTTIPDEFLVVVTEGSDIFYAGDSAPMGEMVLVDNIANAHTFNYASPSSQLQYFNPDSSSVLDLFTLSSSPGSSALYYETLANITGSGGAAVSVMTIIDAACHVNISDSSNYGTPYIVNDCSGVLYLIDSFSSPAYGCIVPDSITIEYVPQPPATTTQVPSSSETGSLSTFSPNPTSPSTPTNWVYDGCVGSTNNYSTTFTIVEINPAQTVDLCLAACQDGGYKYAGLHDTQCYCAHALDNMVSTELAFGNCDILCPGNDNEYCGGNSLYLLDRKMLNKRQYGPNGPLLSLYQYFPPVQSSVTVATPSTSSTAPASGSATGLVASSTTPGGGSTTLITATPAPTSLEVVETVTMTLGQIYISILIEEYIGICGCAKGLDTLTTTSTLTLTHCGCAHEPTYAMPMTVTTTMCDNCGDNGSPSTVTLTVPCSACIATPIATETPKYPAGNCSFGVGNHTMTARPTGTNKPSTNTGVGKAISGIVAFLGLVVVLCEL